VSALEQVRAEIGSVIHTAENVADDGLQPGSDGMKVLAGLILQLAVQVDRLIEIGDGTRKDVPSSSSPNEAETPTEEDATPAKAPADPPRPV
jgi:hypothetical protein